MIANRELFIENGSGRTEEMERSIYFISIKVHTTIKLSTGLGAPNKSFGSTFEVIFFALWSRPSIYQGESE
uniref:Uncharacterized protein n=1 Tax=Lepeophtheirus salmonis TaxID=72036 RepID=A0A0K2T9R3_LEPSM